MKRTLLILILALAGTAALSAQQFAKTGVVNLSRLSQFYKDAKTKAVDELRTSIQKEIDRMKDEIRTLQDQKAEASLIQTKKDALLEFGRKKQEELQAAGDDLKSGASFQKLANQEIEQAAISKGFGLILNSLSTAVLWYGPDADITDDVLQRLQADLSR